MITLDDFVMLGKTVPEEAKRTERVMVCSAGYSPTLRRHVFVPSGQRSYGHRICTCGSLERDSVHQVPELSEEERT